MSVVGESSGPFILGIAGGSGAGKTTLSEALAERFDSSVLTLCLDTYYAAEQLLERYHPAAINWDHPSSVDYETLVGDLDRLRAGLSIPVREYDHSAHRVIVTANRTEPAGIVIIEGALRLSRVCECGRGDSAFAQNCQRYLGAGPISLRSFRLVGKNRGAYVRGIYRAHHETRGHDCFRGGAHR